MMILEILVMAAARSCWRRSSLYLELRSALNSLRRTDQIAPIDIESYIDNDELPQPKSGLDPLVIASLPMFTYNLITSSQLVDDHDHDDEPTECSVCLGTIMEESTVRLLPNCKHFFHVECIDTWLGSQSTCPICRTVAEPTAEPTAPPVVEERAPRGAAQAGKEGGASGSGFGSFRRILGRERSSSRIQSCGDIEVGTQDLER